eukprot:6784686-Lingulodinium_polyedra.AAC.1
MSSSGRAVLLLDPRSVKSTRPRVGRGRARLVQFCVPGASQTQYVWVVGNSDQRFSERDSEFNVCYVCRRTQSG